MQAAPGGRAWPGPWTRRRAELPAIPCLSVPAPEHSEHPCGSPGASWGGESRPKEAKRCWGCPAGLLLDLIRCWVPCWVLSGDVEPCSDTFPRALSLPLPDKCTQGDDLCLPVREGDSAPAGAGSPPCFPCRELEILQGCCALGWHYVPRLVEPCSSSKYPHFCELGET